MATVKKSKYDLIDPANMDQTELDELIIKNNAKRDSYNEQLKATYKRVLNKYKWLWAIPVFGWVIYFSVKSKVLNNENVAMQLTLIKTHIAECEVQDAFIRRRQEQLIKQNNNN
ncbi:hypothetical protein [Mesoplasma lactucae]|uniref:Uncharacterized protein n=1 Tax=Mesoplasma lactucae ATCC 49193 TaxID=81460 RepID=A0A291IRP0_9MOLU|nr:hypothetical protein [Mesoplasma lactucae]ATG97398.1 hypothetical protein CP520_01325 [Mesoplasma lactucae ATCC 49193]ATZ20149.1 hypothetical protein MLACT_v1c03280 [Mesoplasma lactucae ATCC 49193]MCL8216897.1 hypothetical protein [Mesoplasma lactucae ATCC 49193]